ncbi:MAG: hypothetical protein U9N42_07015 [Campylobacterota bacterium]|nr:hypothetical protein [Campylobacterota bacterium]
MNYSMLSISTKKLLDSLESPHIDKNDILLSKVADDCIINLETDTPLPSDIHIDFADYKLILNSGEIAHIFNVKSCCDSISKITQEIVSSMKLYSEDKKIMGVFIHFKVNENFSLVDISEAMDSFNYYANEEASVIFGTTCKEEFLLEDVEVSVMMVG